MCYGSSLAPVVRNIDGAPNNTTPLATTATTSTEVLNSYIIIVMIPLQYRRLSVVGRTDDDDHR